MGKWFSFSSSFLLKDSLIEASNEANLDVAINSINWLSNRQDSISIRGKDVSSQVLKMNQSEQMTIGVLTMVVVPLLIAATGGIVWYRRKNY